MSKPPLSVVVVLRIHAVVLRIHAHAKKHWLVLVVGLLVVGLLACLCLTIGGQLESFVDIIDEFMPFAISVGALLLWKVRQRAAMKSIDREMDEILAGNRCSACNQTNMVPESGRVRCRACGTFA